LLLKVYARGNLAVNNLVGLIDMISGMSMKDIQSELSRAISTDNGQSHKSEKG
jgi:hypothetical protein